jgi:hypothetical protein
MEKVLTVAFLVAQGTTEEWKLNASSTYVSVNANGTVIISKQPDIVNDANKITVKIHMLEQFESDGSSEKNEDLSSLNFLVTRPPVQDGNLHVVYMETESTIKMNGGTLSCSFGILTTNGINSNFGEIISYMAGDILIVFYLSGYTFSKDDNKLKIMIKWMSASPTEITTTNGTDGLVYDLGGNGVLSL